MHLTADFADLVPPRSPRADRARSARRVAELPAGFEIVESINSDAMARGLLAERQLTAAQVERARPELERHTPVMRLVPHAGGPYAIFRMTYRGDGGWSRWALDRGPLDRLVSRYLQQIGTSAFFELL